MEEKIYWYCAGFCFLAIGISFIVSSVKSLRPVETMPLQWPYVGDLEDLTKRVEALEAK